MEGLATLKRRDRSQLVTTGLATPRQRVRCGISYPTVEMGLITARTRSAVQPPERKRLRTSPNSTYARRLDSANNKQLTPAFPPERGGSLAITEQQLTPAFPPEREGSLAIAGKQLTPAPPPERGGVSRITEQN